MTKEDIEEREAVKLLKNKIQNLNYEKNIAIDRYHNLLEKEKKYKNVINKQGELIHELLENKYEYEIKNLNLTITLVIAILIIISISMLVL